MRKLTLENHQDLLPFIAQSDYNEYNSNIVTMLMWSSLYEVYFECYEHYAIACTKMPNHPIVWLMPYGKLAYRKEAMHTIEEISKQQNIAFEIHSMTTEFKNWLQETYPNQFLVWDCHDVQDYIYDRKQQESLIGKKMQKRRNHYNAFIKAYQGRYFYKPLEKEDIPNVYEFLSEWKAKKDDDRSLHAEEAGIHFLLSNMDKLPIQGGCIYIDQKLEAFHISSLLSSDTIEIHVEKANKHIRGLYIAILKLSLETLDDAILYINREDDMGLPELRKAKHDMHPIRKTRKFGSCHLQLTIQKANVSYLGAIRKLWEERFSEETMETSDYYFTHLYNPNDCYLLVSEGELICMLQMRKMTLSIRQEPVPVSFLVGVATNEEYEGCGYMKQLLDYALEIAKKDSAYVILQAYNWDIYKSFGFIESYKKALTKVDKQAYLEITGQFTREIEAQTLLSLYHTYTNTKEGYRVRDLTYYEQHLLPYKKLWKQQVLVHQTNGIADGYIILTEDGDTISVIECIYTNETSLISMLSLLSQSKKKLYVYTDVDTKIQGRRKEQTNMMVKALQHRPFPEEHLFINEEI